MAISQENKQIIFTDFYDLYKKIDDQMLKKLLRSHIAKKCRVDGRTVDNWITNKSIPFYQSDRVTFCVDLIACHFGWSQYTITEKALFPQYALLLESNDFVSE